MKNLGWSYAKLMINLQWHYRYLTNVKFTASDVIWETLCQRLLLVEYFELKITVNQSDHFLRMLSKMTYHFPKKLLGSHVSLTYKRLMKILQMSYKVSKIGSQLSNACALHCWLFAANPWFVIICHVEYLITSDVLCLSLCLSGLNHY